MAGSGPSIAEKSDMAMLLAETTATDGVPSGLYETSSGLYSWMALLWRCNCLDWWPYQASLLRIEISVLQKCTMVKEICKNCSNHYFDSGKVSYILNNRLVIPFKQLLNLRIKI